MCNLEEENNINVLFFGDIVGKPGRDFFIEKLSYLKETYKADFIFANGENCASGYGITPKIAKNLIISGLDGITLGDHVWDQKILIEEIDNIDNICRPANLPNECPGKDFIIVNKNNFKVAIFTVLGRSFMKIKAECPFKTSDLLIKKLKPEVNSIIVEIHAEATAEKIALGRYLEGKVSLVVGTHTHIPTADGQLLKMGTGYITDVGMCGSYDSSLGMDLQNVIKVFLDGIPRRFIIATNDVRLYGCYVTIDRKTGLAISFKNILLYKDNN